MGLATEAYSLSVFGLTATQRMVLASLCKLSRNRDITYDLPDSPAGRSVDIAIVDADDTEAVQDWNSSTIAAGVPVVFISAEPLTNLDAHQYNLIKSHLSGGLLQLLDRVTLSELGQRAPVVVSDEIKVSTDSPKPAEGSARRTTASRILIIDDSLSVRTQMNLCLEKLGVDVEVAADAHNGLEKIQQRHYDLVFLDVMLPDMDGYQVCKLIKRDPRTKRVPVVMLTSKGSTINRIQGSMAGCDRYLTKPATEEDVFKVAAAFLPRAPQPVSLNPVNQH